MYDVCADRQTAFLLLACIVCPAPVDRRSPTIYIPSFLLQTYTWWSKRQHHTHTHTPTEIINSLHACMHACMQTNQGGRERTSPEARPRVRQVAPIHTMAIGQTDARASRRTPRATPLSPPGPGWSSDLRPRRATHYTFATAVNR